MQATGDSDSDDEEGQAFYAGGSERRYCILWRVKKIQVFSSCEQINHWSAVVYKRDKSQSLLTIILILLFTCMYKHPKKTLPSIHVSLLLMTLIVLIQAVCRTPVTYELS